MMASFGDCLNLFRFFLVSVTNLLQKIHLKLKFFQFMSCNPENSVEKYNRLAEIRCLRRTLLFFLLFYHFFTKVPQ